MGVIVDVDACHPPAPTTPSSLVVNTQQSEERGARVVALEGATRSSSDTDTAVAVTAAVNVAEESTDIFSMDGPQTQNATFINGAHCTQKPWRCQQIMEGEKKEKGRRTRANTQIPKTARRTGQERDRETDRDKETQREKEGIMCAAINSGN